MHQINKGFHIIYHFPKYLWVAFCLLVLIFCVSSPDAQAKKHTPDLTEKRYKQAVAYYHNMKFDRVKRQNRQEWQSCVNNFSKYYKTTTSHSLAPKFLYMLSTLHDEMYRRFGKKIDLGEAVAYYEDLAFIHPGDRLADDALLALGRHLRWPPREPAIHGA